MVASPKLETDATLAAMVAGIPHSGIADNKNSNDRYPINNGRISDRYRHTPIHGSSMDSSDRRMDNDKVYQNPP